MIIDNKQSYGSNKNIKTVWDCISDYSNPGKGREGKMDIVTGFFSVAALHILYTTLSKDNKYRIVLGDIHDMARDEDFLKKAVNLLQGDSALESAFQLSTYANNAIAFLRRETVEVRTINNAFCHAKSYVFEDKDDPAHDYGIVGSSNLTEAGLGIKESSNVELNSVETGRENAAVKDLKRWFENQWNTVASAKIAIPENGNTTETDAKAYLIEQIEQIFKAYTPEEIYQKILFEFFRADIEMNDSIEYRRDMEFLQKSRVWNTLFEFQRSGVVSLVKLLTRYGGAILADAVGLGKTFSALGVIKYFQNNGYHTLILCPKKLCNNWTRYKENVNSRFEEDHFNYVVRCHTDLQNNRMDNYDNENVTKDTILSYEKLLVVVDESHNLRNDKSIRYKMLLDEIISESAKRGHTVKVLLLSATPINTGLKDIRNQFKMIGYDGNKHFYDEFKLRGEDPLYEIFRQANNQYTQWSIEPNHTVNTLRDKLSRVPNFFKLTDELIIARNRTFVTTYESSLTFPTQLKPKNEHVSLSDIGTYSNMDAIYDDMKILRLTAYQPTQYEYELYSDIVDRAAEIVSLVQGNLSLDIDNNDTDERVLYNALRRVKDESRSEILQQMIAQNWVVKQSIRRFNAGRINWDNSALRELSLAGMMISLFVKRLESCWDDCLKTITKVRDLHVKWLDLANLRSNAELDDEDETTQEEDIETIGKRTVDFAKMLRVEDYIKDLQRDIEILNTIISNLQQYGDDIAASRRRDEKLDALLTILKNKQECDNKKVVIFTSYTDTANYIFSNVKGILPNVDLVTGDIKQSELEGKLQRFAPYSKLFKEKRWDSLYADAGINPDEIGDTELYPHWRELVKNSQHSKEKYCLDNPIDILVATDCISEGQNLQDADMVINYDIHWNPVRLIQRFGRIDRIGSPNANIQCVNFWPSEDIEAYLRLSDRVSNRMVAMNVAGSETLQANEEIKEMEQNNQFRQSHDAKSLSSIHNDQVGEIEDISNPTFDVLSLAEFKADAETYAKEHLKELERMPNGAFSGFHWSMKPYADMPECLIALLRHRDDAKSFHLLCIPTDNSVAPSFKELDKAEVLNLLSLHKKEQTYLPQDLLNANSNTLSHLSNVIKDWFAPKSEDDLYGSIDNLMGGSTDNAVPGNSSEAIEDRIDIEKYDLIAWDFVSTKENN